MAEVEVYENKGEQEAVQFGFFFFRKMYFLGWFSNHNFRKE